MAIYEYQKNEKSYFRVYCQILGKINKRLRIQKNLYLIETRSQAVKEEKKLIKALAEEMGRLEGKGLYWEEVIHRWEIAAKNGFLGERCSFPEYYLSHVKRLRQHTAGWFNSIASDLSKGDGRALLTFLVKEGYTNSKVGKVRSSINLIYKWGIEERYIAANNTPVDGLTFIDDSEEEVPMILTLEELQKLLYEGKTRDHPWYFIWAFALLTGMRSGELFALRWSDIELGVMAIRVSKSFSSIKKIEKCTKAAYWRTIPISSELLDVINELKVLRGNDEYVLPRISAWRNGYAGAVLRQFLVEIGINKEVVFHTLRACFATHLLASGAEAAKVMAIGGWKDYKTFQIYLRLAGVETAGTTDKLSFIPRPKAPNLLMLKNNS